MTPDLIIRNGLVIDGTGAPGRIADVTVRDGKIAAIGTASGDARRVIDATGQVVAPGFIDPHTHYDAQIWWDADLTPSPWHGVTTVMMGNCGVGLAPCAPESRVAVAHDLVNVEGIPYDVLEAGVTWTWESFPEFMQAADDRKPALNVGLLAPLTTFRFAVMGDAATERTANEDETAQITALLDETMRQGAFGFSTTLIRNHVGYMGRPLACKLASHDELRAYAGVLRKYGRGAIELALCQSTSIVGDAEMEMLDLLLSASGRKVTWLALVDREDKPDACDESLAKAADLIRRGAIPQIAVLPLTREFDLHTPHIFASFPSWHRAANRPVEEQLALFASREFRDQFRAEMSGPSTFTGNWNSVRVADVADPALKSLETKTIAAIAAERGCDGVDAILDIAVADGMKTLFTAGVLNMNLGRVAKLVANPDTLIGLSDGGAHLGILCDAGYATYVLGHWVREAKVLSLEQAVYRMTAQPAEMFGITDRGWLREGLAADIVVFDPDTVGSMSRPEKRHDLPGGGKRFVMRSQGVSQTIVNGAVVYEAGEMTGVRSGRLIRAA